MVESVPSSLPSAQATAPVHDCWDTSPAGGAVADLAVTAEGDGRGMGRNSFDTSRATWVARKAAPQKIPKRMTVKRFMNCYSLS
jgi:hypothetical protein